MRYICVPLSSAAHETWIWFRWLADSVHRWCESTFFGHIVFNVRYCSSWIVNTEHWIYCIRATPHTQHNLCSHFTYSALDFILLLFFIIFNFIRVFSVGVRISLWFVSDALRNSKCCRTELNWIGLRWEGERQRKKENSFYSMFEWIV